MPKLPLYENNVYPDASPLYQAGKGAERRGYYVGSMIEKGANALARGVAGFQRGQAQDDKLAAAQEVGNLTAQMAQTQAQLAVQWKATLAKADPNDPNVAQNFMDNVVTPQFDTMGENLTTDKGRNYFAVARARAWGSLYKSTYTDNANLQARNAVDQVHSVAKSYSDASYFDPTNWKEHMAQADGAVAAYQDAHGLPSKDAIALKSQFHTTIAKSAVDGMIAQNPQAALDAINKGEFNNELSGTDLAAATKKAEAGIRAQANDAKAAETAQNKALKIEGNKALDDLEASVAIDPQTGKHTVPPDYFTKLNDIRNKYGNVIPPSTFQAAGNWASTEVRRNEKTIERSSDANVYGDFVKRAADGSLTRAEVYQARANGSLSARDFGFFRGWVGKASGGDRQELSTVNGLINSYKGYIDTSLGGDTNFTNTWGKSRFSEFKSDMIQKWQEAKANGMSLDDFHNYMSKAIASYTFQQKDIDAEIKRDSSEEHIAPPESVSAPDFNAAGPGVSIEDYLKQHGSSEAAPMPRSTGGTNLSTIIGTQPGRLPVDTSNMNPVVLSKWERVQGILGYQVPVVSEYRDPVHNTEAKGAKDSAHLRGDAIDIDVSKMSIPERLRLISSASALGFTGIGVYDNSIHLDVEGRRAWGPSRHSDSIPAWAQATIAAHMKNQYLASAGSDYGTSE